MTDQGCLIEDSITVRYIDTEALDLGADESLCADEAIQLIAPEGSESYIWSTGEQTSSITVTEPGYYYLTIVQDGCMTTDSILINRREECHTDCNIYIPNAIKMGSTNRKNDAFGPNSSCQLLDYSLEIYDRWGGKVYQSTDPSDTWRGDVEHNGPQAGVYQYAIRYRYTEESSLRHLKGTVTVLR